MSSFQGKFNLFAVLRSWDHALIKGDVLISAVSLQRSSTVFMVALNYHQVQSARGSVDESSEQLLGHIVLLRIKLIIKKYTQDNMEFYYVWSINHNNYYYNVIIQQRNRFLHN